MEKLKKKEERQGSHRHREREREREALCVHNSIWILRCILRDVFDKSSKRQLHCISTNNCTHKMWKHAQKPTTATALTYMDDKLDEQIWAEWTLLATAFIQICQKLQIELYAEYYCTSMKYNPS